MDSLTEGWLGRRIAEAQREIETWPVWMREASHFEGDDNQREEV